MAGLGRFMITYGAAVIVTYRLAVRRTGRPIADRQATGWTTAVLAFAVLLLPLLLVLLERAHQI